MLTCVVLANGLIFLCLYLLWNLGTRYGYTAAFFGVLLIFLQIPVSYESTSNTVSGCGIAIPGHCWMQLESFIMSWDTVVILPAPFMINPTANQSSLLVGLPKRSMSSN